MKRLTFCFLFLLSTLLSQQTLADSNDAAGKKSVEKYPPCDKDGTGLVLDKKNPYKKCFLSLVFSADNGKLSYEINLDTFPLDGHGDISFPDGVRYSGQIKSGLPYGKGKVFFPAAYPFKSYEGEFSNIVSRNFSSEAEWNPLFDDIVPGIDYLFSEKNGKRDIFSPYIRRFSLTLINGDGEFINKDGSKTAGFFVNGIKSVDGTNNNPVGRSDTRHRHALVISNSSYSSLPKLINAINDGRLITQSLRSAGFKVSAHENLDLTGMQNAIRSFGDQLGKNDVGLIYFAGHGVQVKGKNYLIPVRENIRKSFEVPANAVDVDLLLATLENVKNDLNIVILDACRSPFPGESRGTARGLATMDAARGTFIAFSTAPGREASDGTGSNSPYTKHLARALEKKGLLIEQVFKEVRKAVVAETDGEQTPWENSSVMGDFYFKQ